MKNIIKNKELIDKMSPAHSGVFTLSELSIILSISNSVSLYRRIGQLQKLGVIKRFSRGIYITDEFSLEVVSQKICPASYLSLGTVLAKELLIGSIPQKRVYAIKVGKSRRYASEWGEVVHLGITKSLYFGFTVQDGVQLSEKEKAFLDTLYYYQKGQKFSFNVLQDINLELLDKKIVKEYLKKYKNSKFVSFVQGVLGD